MALVTVASPVSQGSFQRPQKLNIYILDVSGSMGWCTKQLGQDTSTRIRQLPLGDAILVGLFSSPGWFRWLPGRVLQEPTDYDQIARMVEAEIYARATTCFSEIMADVPKAIAPFLAGFSVVALTFMSDGCAVVPDLVKEFSALDTAAQAVAPYLTAGAVVAYGDYADRQTLMRLASTLGLEFVTASHLNTIGETFSRHADSVAQERRQVPIPAESTLTFAQEKDGTVTPLEPKDGAVTASDSSHVYSITRNGGDAAWVKGTPEDLVYSSALAYVRQGNVDDAVSLLAMLGDVAMVRALSNALTNAEIAHAETLLQGTIADPAKRFVDGREPGVLPKDDAFDLLDVLTLLVDDKDCKFYPRHQAFHYKRIGRAGKQKDGYPTFSPTDAVGVPFAGLVGNKAELNLSVLVSVPGVLLLPQDMAGIPRPKTLPDLFPSRIWRTYSLIANALPVVTQLPVTLSESAYRVLCQERVIRHRQKYDPARIEVLDLNRVPVCNKLRGRNATDWDRMATLSLVSLRLGTWMKVFKAKVEELDPGKAGKQPTAWTKDESDFLVACGMRYDGSYNPPIEVEEATDVLDIRSFEVRPQHDSSVSMKDFASMLAGKKKWNYVGGMMRDAQEFMGEHILGNLTEAHHLSRTVTDALAWLRFEIETLSREKRQIDMELHTRRFAVALTGSWRQHFATEEVEITSAGHPVVLSFTHAQKKI